MQTVLLPIDGSHCSTAAMNWCAKTFSAFSTRFIIFYVIEKADEIPPRGKNAAEHPKELQKKVTILLSSAKKTLESHGATVYKTVHKKGKPIEEICAFAEEESVDMVVVGSHGRTGLNKLLLGSVSEGVLEQCRRPVVIYKDQMITAVPE